MRATQEPRFPDQAQSKLFELTSPPETRRKARHIGYTPKREQHPMTRDTRSDPS